MDNKTDEHTNNKKSRDGQWIYTRTGKRVRGVLCMLTFCLFMLFLLLCIYVFRKYGMRILTDPDYYFYDSFTFKNEIRDEAAQVLNNALELDASKGKQTFDVYNVEKGKLESYDLKAMAEDGIDLFYAPDNFYDYAVSSEKPSENFYKFDDAANLIENMNGNSYIYLTKSAFKRIFTQDGIVNTGHCFSDEFSESAYVVYRDPEVMDSIRDAEKVLREMYGIDIFNGSLGSDTDEEAADNNVDGNNAGKADDESVSGEKVESNEVTFSLAVGQDTVISQIENGEDSSIADIIREYVYGQTEISLDETEYAVYDPEQQLFFSTWDDYFNENEYYLYDAKEVAAVIRSHEFAQEYMSSIIFPVLWSENYDDIWHLVERYYVRSEEYERALRGRENSAFIYYIEIGNNNSKNVYTNAGSPEKADEWDGAWGLTYRLGERAASLPETERSIDELFQYEDLKTNLYDYDSDGVMYFGLNPVRLQIEDESTTAQVAWGYEKLGRYIVVFIVCAVIFFVLLMFQAGLLIRTTGREPGKDKKLKLIGIDKIFTELWFILYIAGTAACIGFELLALIVSSDYVSYRLGDRESAYAISLIMVSVVYSLPFVLFFMVMTLSLARRIKAHNLLRRSLLRRLTLTGVHWIKKRKSADKLKILTMAYIGIEIIVFLIMAVLVYAGAIRGDSAIGIMFVFFVIMWSGTAYIMSRVISDISALKEGVFRITEGDLDTKVELKGNSTLFKDLADGINHTSDGLKNAMETSLKDERMKTELITNVSHDLKTPLTSMINYIDLLKREKMPTPEAEHYVEVLDSKALRLKQLTEDLVEAAKATSGNIELDMIPLSFEELVKQALGEFEDKFAEKRLEVVAEYEGQGIYPQSVHSTMVLADGRRLFRILDNVLQNAYKYAMEGTRIYINLKNEDSHVSFIMKNISKAQLNISADELMERFTRGDASRTTEGSGLGLSIAKDLTRLMGGSFELELDGDLFKVMITFPRYYDGEKDTLNHSDLV